MMEGAGLEIPRRPLTRDISVGRASKGAQPPAKAAQCFWATKSAARGVRSITRLWSRVVSVAETNKRRVALALAGEELANTLGSSFSCESTEQAKERRKPAARWLNCGYGGGLLMQEYLSVEDAPGCSKPPSLTGWRKSSSIWLHGIQGTGSRRGMRTSVRGRITQPRTRLITPRQGSIARCGARAFS
jgi:hypothetical protein